MGVAGSSIRRTQGRAGSPDLNSVANVFDMAVCEGRGNSVDDDAHSDTVVAAATDAGVSCRSTPADRNVVELANHFDGCCSADSRAGPIHLNANSRRARTGRGYVSNLDIAVGTAVGSG